MSLKQGDHFNAAHELSFLSISFLRVFLKETKADERSEDIEYQKVCTETIWRVKYLGTKN